MFNHSQVNHAKKTCMQILLLISSPSRASNKKRGQKLTCLYEMRHRAIFAVCTSILGLQSRADKVFCLPRWTCVHFLLRAGLRAGVRKLRHALVFTVLSVLINPILLRIKRTV